MTTNARGLKKQLNAIKKELILISNKNPGDLKNSIGQPGKYPLSTNDLFEKGSSNERSNNTRCKGILG